MLIVRHHEVRDILAGREHEVLRAVREAYLLHDAGSSVLPHSTFLRLPPAQGGSESANRIIGLPAFLGGDVGTAGVKWIASFPGNLTRGIDRASAVMVLNSLQTGHPEALIEASLVSASRTAASAALAADLLTPPGGAGLTLVGCGVINQAVLRYVRAVRPGLREVVLYDNATSRAQVFAQRCQELMPDLAVTITEQRERALAAHDLISIATTATTPHMDLDAVSPGTVVLHISLRDLTPQAVLAHHNVTDDADHVCRERTSLHLAEQITGDRGFIDATLGGMLRTGERFPPDPGKAVIFSPFGLGVLDIAVARLIRDEAQRQGLGARIDAFLPDEVPSEVSHVAHSQV